MKEILYFPKLGWVFNLSKIAFSIGPIKIYWYGILITLGFISAIFYLYIISKKFKLNIDDVIDIIIYSLIGGIIGARAYYVVFNFDIYRNNLWDIFKIWEGGIAIYGGIIGAFIVGIFMCKKKRMAILPMMDLAVGGLILGQAIGRWGNFFNIEAFGNNTDFVWGMTSISIQRYLFEVAPKLAAQGITINPIGNVHPCFFYESMWCFIGFVIIMLITINSNYNFNNNDDNDLVNKKKFNLYSGELTLIYFAWYSFGRFIIEGLRVDSLMIGSLRVSRLLSMILFIISIILLVISRLIRTRKNRLGKLKKDKNVSVSVNIGSADEILKRFSDEEDQI